MGNDAFAALRSMLDRPIPVDEALVPYLGIDIERANAEAGSRLTHDGLLRERLHGLVTILALREVPAALGPTVAALLWRSAPIAADVGELIVAMHRLSAWRSGLAPEDVDRIRSLHRVYEARFDALMEVIDDPCDPAFDELLRELEFQEVDDHVVLEMGGHLVVVEMSSTHYFIGVQSADGTTYVIDSVPHAGPGDGGGRDDAPEPDGPRPRILQDA